VTGKDISKKEEAKIVESTKKRYGLASWLGLNCISITRGSEEKVSDYIADYCNGYVTIVNARENKLIDKVKIGDIRRYLRINGTINPLVVEVTKLTEQMYVIAITGRYYSIIPDRDDGSIVYETTKFDSATYYPKAIMYGAADRETKEAIARTTAETVDKLFVLNRGVRTELRNIIVDPQDSVILWDTFTEEIARHVVSIETGEDIIEPVMWAMEPVWKSPTVWMTNKGEIIWLSPKTGETHISHY
jgi:hypothetical protein